LVCRGWGKRGCWLPTAFHHTTPGFKGFEQLAHPGGRSGCLTMKLSVDFCLAPFILSC
jgi:hypothetical protein